MSQKVRVTHVKVKGGQPYLGQHDGMPRYSDDPDAVMRWLCDGWRSRYNQCRSTRRKYGPDHELIPIGDTVTDLTDAQARRACPWLAALPTLILQSPSKLEAVEWYSNVKRRKTARKQHRNPGRMPRFKSRHHARSHSSAGMTAVGTPYSAKSTRRTASSPSPDRTRSASARMAHGGGSRSM